MVTIIMMWRSDLITAEAVEDYCKGNQKEKESVNDDLESFFKDIRLGKEPGDSDRTYFFQKLSEEELEFVFDEGN